MNGDVKILTQAQLDKQTAFKVGESYHVGEMIVTLHANKESMQAAIKAVDAKREAHHAALHERAIDLMLMTPEQLQVLKIEEWFKSRNKKHGIISGIMGRLGGKRYIEPAESTPSGKPAERFKELMKEVKEKVH